MGKEPERCGFMHNLFNFSSFNIVLNENRNVSSARTFRPMLACDLNSDGGWRACHLYLLENRSQVDPVRRDVRGFQTKAPELMVGQFARQVS